MGPLLVILIMKAMMGKIKIPMVKKNKTEKTMSNPRFKILFSFLSNGRCPTLTTGTSPILLI